jgi:hypothetical protein
MREDSIPQVIPTEPTEPQMVKLSIRSRGSGEPLLWGHNLGEPIRGSSDYHISISIASIGWDGN